MPRPGLPDDRFAAVLQRALPRLEKRWAGHQKVRGQAESRPTDRLQELGLRSLEAYRGSLAAHPDEWNRIDTMCRIAVSCFYRDPAVFDALRDPVLPAVAQQPLPGQECAAPRLYEVASRPKRHSWTKENWECRGRSMGHQPREIFVASTSATGRVALLHSRRRSDTLKTDDRRPA